MRNVVVLDSIAAAAADISFVARKLNITDCPEIDYLKIVSIGQGVLSSLNETVQIYRLNFVAANDTEYSYTITQIVDGVPQIFTGSYTSDASGTATEIGEGLELQFNKLTNFQVVASHTGANTYVTFTANSGYPLFTLTAVANTNVTDPDMDLVPTIASNTTADPTVITTSAPHGLAVGDLIDIASASEANLASGRYRVRSTPLVTTFTATDPTGQTTLAGTATTTGTITRVATPARGDSADVTAQGGTPTAGNEYAQIKFVYNQAVTPLMEAARDIAGNELILFANEGDGDFAAFRTRLIEVLQAYVPSTTDADPEAVSVK